MRPKKNEEMERCVPRDAKTPIHYARTKSEAQLAANEHQKQPDTQHHVLVYGPDKFSCRDCGAAWKWTEDS